MKSGLIYDIKRYAINDGPGIRVTIFMKGCPLQCSWCHNPEGISPLMQKLYTPEKCIGCDCCIQVCPEQSCFKTPDGIKTEPARCTACGKCADICPTKATEISGRNVSIEDIVAEVEKDRIFFDQSGGGVTFSGGEPLLQADFLLLLLKEFGTRAIHRTVDTTGFAKSETLLNVAKHTDLFLYDLKLMDTTRHRKWTSVGNGLILKNLRLLAETGADIIIRIPLIKGVNADDENIVQTADFIAALPGKRKGVNLLPYHNIMAGKYLKSGIPFEEGQMCEPGDDDLERVVAVFAQYGLKATVGG